MDIAQHWIDGAWRNDGDVAETISVYTGGVNATYASAGAAVAEDAIAVARRPFER
jgi:acyl-CoA reductase-like NAD-dependent aldehyde dehydrogenase